jgi:VWFA-related protein
MKKAIATFFAIVLMVSSVALQTPQKPEPQIAPEDIIRISTSLVQTDVVVTDKSEQVIPDLKLEDFELYDNGKKQDVKFMEFVSVDTGRRAEGTRPSSMPNYADQTTGSGVAAKDLRRVVAFVIDDLTLESVDIPAVRKMLLDFVNNKMQDGDLVAIIRVVGGKGLLQQFTADRQLLRRAIDGIRTTVHPLSASNVPDPQMPNLTPAPSLDSAAVEEPSEAPAIYSANDDTARYFRGLSVVSTANYVINSLREIPGRKDLVMISAGIPIFEINTSSANVDIQRLLKQLTDSATRAGVVISALDPRGMRAAAGVKGFQATPAKSAMGGTTISGNDRDSAMFGRGDAGNESALGAPMAGANEHLGLSTVSKETGGVVEVNTNDFDKALDKIMAHSRGYYTLAYTPNGKFDRTYHKLEIKVKRPGTRVYGHAGYVAREETNTAPKTKEEAVAAAARSPLAKNDIDVTPNIAVKFLPGNKAGVDINLLIDAKKLNFKEDGDKHQDSLDVVGMIFDQLGRNRGGFSETINLNLSAAEYQKALTEGLTYSANTEVQPDYYQVRMVVREADTGSLGSFSKYLEVPDLTKGKLAVSSLFLFATDATRKTQAPLQAVRRLSRKQDLLYAALIYNAKMKDGKPALRSQLIITQGNKELFREPEQAVEASGNGPLTKKGQLALAGVAPGHYVLTLVITDTSVDKKFATQARSIDFTVVN